MLTNLIVLFLFLLAPLRDFLKKIIWQLWFDGMYCLVLLLPDAQDIKFRTM